MEVLSLVAAILTLLCFSDASSIYQTQQDTAAFKGDIADVQFPFRPSFYYTQVGNFDEAEMQSNTAITDERSCYTTQGRSGSCMSLHSCYPTSKLNNLETWSVIIQTPCSFIVKDGRQIHGICCPKQVAIPHSGFSKDIQITPLVLMPYPAIPYSAILYPSMATNVASILPAETPIPPSLPLTDMPVAIESKQISCGVGPKKIPSLEENRIVGGTDAVKHSWPHAVLIKFAGVFLCSGTLISSNRVLTGAQCANFNWPWEYSRITVELGVHVVLPISDAMVSRRVFMLLRHRDYNPDTMANDIAILVLKFPVNYVKEISPVCLPAPGTTDTYLDEEAAIIGWGSLKNQNGPFPGVLQQATTKIISNADCQASYDSIGVTIEDSMICAIVPDISSCYYDSGAPLLVKLSTGRWIQVGIDSFGVECASPDFPIVYTRVTSFSTWISNRM